MKIAFEDSTHTYTNTQTKKEYISATTLIHKYVPEFDSQYWSLYKAVKDVLEKHNQFKIYKLSVGGWEQVVSSWNRNPLMRYQSEVEAQQLEYLIRWDVISDAACDIGMAEHKRRELEICNQDYYEHDNTRYQTPKTYTQRDILHMQDFASNSIFAELLVYNDAFKVAGQVDWVRKKGRSVWIKDYKTSREITKKSFRDEKLLTPLNDLFNANWYIYAMQLSLYGWMLEQCGYNVRGLEVVHTRSETTYDMPYLKDQVTRMLEDYVTF